MADFPIKKRRFNEADWASIAEEIKDDFNGRKRRRSDLDKQWDQIDRQLRMEPAPLVDANGRNIKGSWLPNMELPNQAQSLEVLNADARRLMFSDDRNYFSAHVGIDDDELNEDMLEFATLEAMSGGEKFESIVEGALTHFQGQYDHRGAWDRLNAEAFKYGKMVGRVVMVSGEKFDNSFRGVVRKGFEFPAVVPRSVRNVYVDDSTNAVMNEGMMISPSFIEHHHQKLDDLMLAAKKGSSDMTRPNGGWMPKRFKNIEADKNGNVEVIVYEGDLIVPRSTGPNMFIPNVRVSTVVGSGKSGISVFRMQENPYPFRSYFTQDYHSENITSAYGVSPLMKGAPIQVAAATAWNRLTGVIMLNAQPPVSWNPADPHFQKTGGPEIWPGAMWQALTDPKVHQIGDAQALMQAFVMLQQLYSDMVGVNAPRLGAQTKSHQTAFAIDTEQTRGQVRTVDYVRSLMYGGMADALSMEYEMLRRNMKKQPVYVPKAGEFLEFGKELLPGNVVFDVHGAGGPIEERERAAERQLALNQALQVEGFRLQSGQPPKLNLDAIQEYQVGQAFKGFAEIDRFFNSGSEGPSSGVANGLPVSGDSDALAGNPSDILANLAGVAGF